jgi:cell division protein FtsZ
MVQELTSHIQLEESAGAPGTPQGVPANGRRTMQSQRMPTARIAAVGVGGAGTNAINHMIKVQVSGVEFLAMNTDAQALELALAPVCMRLGENLTHGLGAGGNPLVGEKAAEESYSVIREQLKGFDMVFITAGMGGGTGTGASPLVAQAAREAGALTVAVVTSPFAFERRRKQIALKGVESLREVVDALILVPNDRLMELNPGNLGAFEAYRLADDILRQGIQGISDLVTIPGLINLDFADIRAIMTDTGSALMAICCASGEHRAEQAARGALSNPLLDSDICGARGVIFNITGSDDLTMTEVHTIADSLAAAAHPEANLIFGSVYDPSLSGAIKLTVVATGFEPRVVHPDLPVNLHAQPSQPALISPPEALLRQGPDKPGNRRSAPQDSRQDNRASDEEDIRLRRLEELRVRRRETLVGSVEEEYLAGDDRSGNLRQKSWQRLIFRRSRNSM